MRFVYFLNFETGTTAVSRKADPMVIPGSNFTATSSLYWLLQNGAIAIYAIADPLIVAGQGASVRRYVYI